MNDTATRTATDTATALLRLQRLGYKTALIERSPPGRGYAQPFGRRLKRSPAEVEAMARAATTMTDPRFGVVVGDGPVWVVDIDAETAEQRSAARRIAADALGEPDFELRTTRPHGLHLYYTADPGTPPPEGTRNGSRGLRLDGCAVDLLAGNFLVFAHPQNGETHAQALARLARHLARPGRPTPWAPLLDAADAADKPNGRAPGGYYNGNRNNQLFKDSCDAWRRGGRRDDLEALRRRALDSGLPASEADKTMASAERSVAKERAAPGQANGAAANGEAEGYADDELPVLIQASSLVLDAHEWLLHRFLAMEELTMLAGEIKKGKSTIAAHVTAMVTTGDPKGWPGVKPFPPRDVVVYASEDHLQKTLAPSWAAMGADMSRIRVVGDIPAWQRAFDPSRDLRRLEEQLDRKKVKPGLLVIDPVIDVGPPTMKENTSKDVRNAMQPLQDMVERVHCAALLVHHFRKQGTSGAKDTNPLDRILGSIAWAAKCRMLWTATDMLEPDGEKSGRALMRLANNLTNEAPPNGFRYTIEAAPVGDGHRVKEGTKPTGRRLIVGAPVHESADEVMHRRPEPDPERAQAKNAALAWLVPYFQAMVQQTGTPWHLLEDTSMERSKRAEFREMVEQQELIRAWQDVIDEAGRDDISEHTLRRARDELAAQELIHYSAVVKRWLPTSKGAAEWR